MHKVGILFDIDKFERALYGYAAYQIFFDAIDTRKLGGCSLRDGDTTATVKGDVYHYCIAVESEDPSKIKLVKEAFIDTNAKALLPPRDRFLEDAQVTQEPLVLAARINSKGELIGCKTSWIIKAWKESKENWQEVDNEIPSSVEEDKEEIADKRDGKVKKERRTLLGKIGMIALFALLMTIIFLITAYIAYAIFLGGVIPFLIVIAVLGFSGKALWKKLFNTAN